MSCYSEKAKSLASLFAAQRLRRRWIENRIRALNNALVTAIEDETGTADELIAEAGQDHEYLVGALLVRVETGPRRSVALHSPTVAPEVVPMASLAQPLPENDDDLPQRAIKLVASK